MCFDGFRLGASNANGALPVPPTAGFAFGARARPQPRCTAVCSTSRALTTEPSVLRGATKSELTCNYRKISAPWPGHAFAKRKRPHQASSMCPPLTRVSTPDRE